jgi:hypothetical protein
VCIISGWGVAYRSLLKKQLHTGKCCELRKNVATVMAVTLFYWEADRTWSLDCCGLTAHVANRAVLCVWLDWMGWSIDSCNWTLYTVDWLLMCVTGLCCVSDWTEWGWSIDSCNWTLYTVDWLLMWRTGLCCVSDWTECWANINGCNWTLYTQCCSFSAEIPPSYISVIKPKAQHKSYVFHII